MIRREDVLENLEKKPFEPFRICMSDGRTYDVPHSDLCMVARTTVYVGVPDRRVRKGVMRVDQCALAHIVRFEPLNGHAQRGTRQKRK